MCICISVFKQESILTQNWALGLLEITLEIGTEIDKENQDEEGF